ncbi:MAG: hypothetical protein EBU49_09235 [Proteobacteria bacterium]|nr:hypothetical protein [Pseudomonadota bacterium]
MKRPERKSPLVVIRCSRFVSMFPPETMHTTEGAVPLGIAGDSKSSFDNLIRAAAVTAQRLGLVVVSSRRVDLGGFDAEIQILRKSI